MFHTLNEDNLPYESPLYLQSINEAKALVLSMPIRSLRNNKRKTMREIARALASIYRLTGIPIFAEMYNLLSKSIEEKESYERMAKAKKAQMERAKQDIKDANPFKKSS